MKEVNARLGFLLDVGLDYLSLARPQLDLCLVEKHSAFVLQLRSVAG
jgi:excinuclease UvrABC ATPase subunit